MNNKYRESIQKLGMNVLKSGRVLGVSPRQTQRFAAGAEVSAPVRKLLEVMLKYGVDPKEVEEL